MARPSRIHYRANSPTPASERSASSTGGIGSQEALPDGNCLPVAIPRLDWALLLVWWMKIGVAPASAQASTVAAKIGPTSYRFDTAPAVLPPARMQR